MITRDLRKLIENEEAYISSLFVSKEYATLKKRGKGYRFDNLNITPKGYDIIGIQNIITDDYIKSLRDMFPPYHKGNMNSVREKLERFLGVNDYTLEQISDAFKTWNDMKQEPYCGKADNFIYLKKDGTEISRLQEVLEEITSSPKNTDLNLL